MAPLMAGFVDTRFSFALLTGCLLLGACTEPLDTPGDCETCGSSGGSSGAGGAGSTGGSGAGGTQVPGSCEETADFGTAPPVESPMTLEVNDAITVTIHLNHLGYTRESAKRAVVAASGHLEHFQILRASDQSVVFEGELEAAGELADWDRSEQFFVADFSTLREEGSFQVLVNGETSAEFLIGPRLYFEHTFQDVLSFFKSSRADDDVVWSADEAIQKWNDDSATYDVRGGWYDADGDISKYLSHLSYANFMNPQQIPLTAWGLAWVRDQAAELLDDSGDTAGVEDEALWGADYLVRVFDPEGYFYINVFDVWSGELDDRFICAYEGDGGTRTAEFQAGFREGGGMSIAALARIARWNRAGAFSADEYLEVAERGFEHLLEHNTSYVDDGKENIIDDYTALLAATELYATTEKEEYLTAARERVSALAARLHETGYFIADDGERPFWHASDAGLPVVALVRYAEVESDPDERSWALDIVTAHLGYLLRVTSEVDNPFGYARQHINVGTTVKSSFFIPQDNETGYWYQGESARLASLATAALLGGRAIASSQDCPGKPSLELSTYAMDQLDWILGKNIFDISFLKGTGRNNPPAYCNEKQPIHGVLVGGISNGITSSQADGSGIQWLSAGGECWENWRWLEQWLPHSTWYMLAITAAAL